MLVTQLGLKGFRCTVMIRFSAHVAYLLTMPQGRALNRNRELIRDRTLIFVFEKQPNVQTKLLISIRKGTTTETVKITNIQ